MQAGVGRGTFCGADSREFVELEGGLPHGCSLRREGGSTARGLPGSRGRQVQGSPREHELQPQMGARWALEPPLALLGD